MIEPIKNIKAVKILDFTKTKGSAPIKVLCDDSNIYYAKTTEKNEPPLQELINEIVCNYYAAIWGLKIPATALVSISNEIISDYINEVGIDLPQRYSNVDFDNKPFIGSQLIPNHFEIDEYIGGISGKVEFKQFSNPLDLIKIGLFDLWLCNMDRKPDNPNVLISEIDSKLVFHPIDHTAAFAYQPNLKVIKLIHLRLEERKCLLSTNFSLNILKFAKKADLNVLNSVILQYIENCIKQSELIFSQIPSEWGFSKSAKNNILNLLSDVERNKIIADSYIKYIK